MSRDCVAEITEDLGLVSLESVGLRFLLMFRRDKCALPEG